VINLCLFGAGRIGSVHAACVAKNSDVKIKYISDVNRTSAEQLAKKYHAQVVDVAFALSDPDIQGVIIALSLIHI